MKCVTSDTIARTVIFGIALINQVLAVLGKETLPFAENDIYQLVTLIATIISGVIAWWKNNSFTQEAIKADEIMKCEKLKHKNIH